MSAGAVLGPEEPGSELLGVLDETTARSLVDEIRRRGAQLVELAAQLEVEREDFEQVVGMAYRHQAWISLGYGSWEEMVRAEFSGEQFFASVEERRGRVQALISEGLSTRAIGDVLGIGRSTVSRDAQATVPTGTVATAAAAGAQSITTTAPGLDGKERPRTRTTDAEHAERVIKVAQRRAEGWTQKEIGEELGVTQRTISTDDRRVQEWREELGEEGWGRLESGQMSRREMAESLNLRIVERSRPRLESVSRSLARSVSDSFRALGESVVYADAWLEERGETSAILGGPLANAAGQSVEWLALDLDYEAFPEETLQVLCEDLTRTAAWVERAQERLRKVADARGMMLDEQRVRDQVAQKAAAREGAR